MKSIVKKAIRDEKGAALALTLVLLLVGGLIIAPLLGFMGTGLIAGGVHEKRMDELYAADAGVEDAIWKIHNPDAAELPPIDCDDSPWEEPHEYAIPPVNGKEVQVYIEYRGGRIYRITSTATTDSNSSTTVVADYWALSFADNAITSRVNVDLGNNSYVEGRIQYGQDLNSAPNANYDPENAVKEEYVNWPSSDELYDYYYPRYVEGKYFEYCDHGDCVIDAKDTPQIGPLYRVGDLDFMSSDNKVERELGLTGTIYVTDDVYVGDAPQAQDFILNLNGQTIFCEGDIYVTGKTTVIGSGSIIAKGDIYFEPNFTSSDGYILLLALEGNVNFMPGGDFTGFVMSADGQVDFKPGGTFYGSVAGDVHVDLDSNVTVIYQSALDADIDFPFEAFANWRIGSYNIILETD